VKVNIRTDRDPRMVEIQISRGSCRYLVKLDQALILAESIIDQARGHGLISSNGRALATAELKYQRLAQAVRDRSNDRGLLKMVGPTPDELAAAEARLRALDLLHDQCQWGLMPCPNEQARDARERYNQIMDVQAVYEAKYPDYQPSLIPSKGSKHGRNNPTPNQTLNLSAEDNHHPAQRQS